MNSQLENPNDRLLTNRCCHHRGISYSAILTGALIALGISFVFNLFAMAIGLSVFADTTTGPKTLAIGGVIGMLIITIFATGIGGWVAGYLGRPRGFHRDMGVIYGFTSWCLALLLMVLLSGHMAKFVSYNVSSLHHAGYSMNYAGHHNNDVMPTDAATGTMVTNAQGNGNPPVVTSEDQAHAAAVGLYITFALCFIGALSSALGGHLGARSYDKDKIYYEIR